MRSASLFAVAVLAVLMLSAVMPASAHVNLLQNPGFETGSPAPWIIDGSGSGPGPGLDWRGGVSSNGAHTGAYYAWVGVNNAYAYVLQDIGPPRCAQYLELWYHGWTGGGVVSFGVYVYYTDGTNLWKELSPTDAWSFVHIDLDTAKLVNAVEAKIWAEGGEIYVDDFDLEACPAAAVGGIVTPVNAFTLLAPWLAVTGLVGCIGTVVVVAKKRRP